MSKAADKIEKFLKDGFPTYRVRKEKNVVFSHTTLKFDFYIPEFKIAIEVQGEQHFRFNKFFHVDKYKFQSQKYRDKLKTQWAESEGVCLITLTENEIEKMDLEGFKNLIINSL